MKKKDKTFYCIVGCGNLGSHLANVLSERGEEVLIIDKNKNSFKKLNLNFSGLNVEGDATDLTFLKNVGIENAKLLIAVTHEDNLNLMVCQIAKEIYDIKVVARLSNVEKKSIYLEFGIDVICPDDLVATEIYNRIENIQ
jgi:trk system potassium uptake protein TrkA